MILINLIFICQAIGPIGKHYAVQWAEEDLNQQMKEGSRFVDLDGKASPNVGQKRKGADVTIDSKSFKRSASFMLDETLQNLNKTSQTQSKHDTLTYGPLTQSKLYTLKKCSKWIILKLAPHNKIGQLLIFVLV